MISVALMGHPKRARFIQELLPQLPGAKLVLDEKNDRWDTGRRALLAYNPEASHHLVVQDDAIPCRSLVRGCNRVARAAGERPVGLYIGSLRPYAFTVAPALKHAKRVGSPWLEMDGPWWGVAIILPTSHIDDLVEWGDRNGAVANYDQRIAKFYKREVGLECWYTLPSLVDHRGVEENPSLIPGRTGNRRARWFIGESHTPHEIDWTRDPVRLHTTFRHPSSHKTARVAVGGTNYQRMTRNKAWEEVARDEAH